MALIIEDGSIVNGAQSFVTAAELVTYADLRGLTYPSTESEQEQILVKAVDYLFSVEDQMKGYRVNSEQDLPYPRECVYLNGFLVADDTIPDQLKYAQIEAALAAQTIDLLTNSTYENIQTASLEPGFSVTYFSAGSYGVARLDRAKAYLDGLLKSNGNNSIMQRV